LNYSNTVERNKLYYPIDIYLHTDLIFLAFYENETFMSDDALLGCWDFVIGIA
jgi:hypothetical protein